MRLTGRFAVATYAAMSAWILVCAPAAAQADWLFTPSLGRTFGADTFGQGHATYGGAVAQVDEESFGWEAEFSYSPEFFDNNTQSFESARSGSVVTAMGNALIGAPMGPEGRFRPYVTGGVGLMRMRVVSDAGTFESVTSEFGFNAGAGALALVGSRIGLRGDLRYLRSFQNQNPSWTRGVAPDIAPGSFDFWRASVGLTLLFAQQ
jgi:opacity protein-like surface antigen